MSCTVQFLMLRTQPARRPSGVDRLCTAVSHVPSAESGAQLLVGRHLVSCAVAFFVPNDKLRIMAFLVRGSWGPLVSLAHSSPEGPHFALCTFRFLVPSTRSGTEE